MDYEYSQRINHAWRDMLSVDKQLQYTRVFAAFSEKTFQFTAVASTYVWKSFRLFFKASF